MRIDIYILGDDPWFDQDSQDAMHAIFIPTKMLITHSTNRDPVFSVFSLSRDGIPDRLTLFWPMVYYVPYQLSIFKQREALIRHCTTYIFSVNLCFKFWGRFKENPSSLRVWTTKACCEEAPPRDEFLNPVIKCLVRVHNRNFAVTEFEWKTSIFHFTRHGKSIDTLKPWALKYSIKMTW